VLDRLTGVAKSYNNDKGMEGIISADNARGRLVHRKRALDYTEQAKLDEMIEMTAQTSALQAINLS